MLILLMALACSGGEEVPPNGDIAPQGAMGAEGPSGQPPEGGQMGQAGGPPPQGGEQGQAGGPPPQGGEMGQAGGAPQGGEGQVGDPTAQGDSKGQEGSENRPKPPTFIFNAQSEGMGPLYKAENGGCFVRVNWDQPPNGVMGEIESIECPSQMSQEGWMNCIGGRLVRHNTGEKEGNCECEAIEGTGPVSVDCL
jgi:hypothetical protein